jgi:hypothetical protein
VFSYFSQELATTILSRLNVLGLIKGLQEWWRILESKLYRLGARLITWCREIGTKFGDFLLEAVPIS